MPDLKIVLHFQGTLALRVNPDLEQLSELAQSWEFIAWLTLPSFEELKEYMK